MPTPPATPDDPGLPEGEPLVLSEREREAFFAILTNPPEPNERLRRALAGLQRVVN